MRAHGLGVFFVGLAAGIALVVACNQARQASASPADCASWQYAKAQDIQTLEGHYEPDLVGTVPMLNGMPQPIYAYSVDGWEPFTVQADGAVLVRRCKP
jgi:hypothetical protein